MTDFEKKVLACIPAEGATTYASMVFTALGATPYQEKAQRNKIRKVLRTLIDRGVVRTDVRFGMYVPAVADDSADPA